jgi:hypothetical protein
VVQVLILLNQDVDGIKQCQPLEADYFVEMIVDVVWQKGLHEILIQFNSTAS